MPDSRKIFRLTMFAVSMFLLILFLMYLFRNLPETFLMGLLYGAIIGVLSLGFSYSLVKLEGL